jgi:hypothetical protein
MAIYRTGSRAVSRTLRSSELYLLTVRLRTAAEKVPLKGEQRPCCRILIVFEKIESFLMRDLS